MNITKIEAGEHLKEAYMTYAMSTILDRALPDVKDGLKPIHRRILYASYEAGITYNKDRAKTTEPVSETMKIHHHGDVSISDAIALMSEQNESLLHPYLDCEGAFGKVYLKDKPSAPRYTYVRLNKFSEEFFKDLNKDILPMIGEDKDHMQPVVLSSSFPNILIKNNSGIAVGEACDFPSFNLLEICNATIAYISNKEIDLFDYITGMDFSTGGYLIYNKSALEKIYNTGQGTVILRAKYKYDKENNCIDIYEIPYTTTVDAIVAKVTDLMKTNKYKTITDVRDETGFNKITEKEEMKITIEIKKNTDVEKLMLGLFKDTTLQDSYSANMNCLVDFTPKVLGVKQILDEWLKFRRECVSKSLQYDINHKSEKLHLLKGLEKVLLDIDKVINIIRNSKDEEIIINLSNTFSIDQTQSENIANMKLRNINKDYIVKQIKDVEKLEKEVETLKHKLNSPGEINNIIISDLIRVRDTYSKPRKTEILYESDAIEIPESDLVEDYTTTIIFTKEQYIKKTRKFSENQKVKEGDEVLNIQQCSNRGKVILLSNKGNAYLLNISDLEDRLPSQLGVFLPSLLDLGKDEIILNMLVTNDYTGHCVVVFENGKIAKIPLSSYQTKNNRKMLANSLSLESNVISIYQVSGDVDIELHDSFGKAKTINTNSINEKSKRDTIGVQAHKSARSGFKIVSSVIIQFNS